MDSGWTPGASRSKTKAAKESLDDLLGDLLDDDSPPKKKNNTPAGRQAFSVKKQSSKDEDFYSSLAQAADEDDKMSDISEADVNQMAKSIADLDDLDADLFQPGPASKTPKRGSLKDKSGKGGTPRRSGTPRSRGGTPRATSPPLRLTSPANRVISPTHQRGASPAGSGRGATSPVRGTDSPAGIDPNRNSSLKSPGRKPTTPSTEQTPEYRPTTAPGKMTDLGDRHNGTARPGQQDQERPKTVPKAKTLDFGDFDADDPLAGIPLSDEDEDLGFPTKKPIQKKSTSPRTAPTPGLETKSIESPRQRNLFDRPPTRSGTNVLDSLEKEGDGSPRHQPQQQQQQQQQQQKPSQAATKPAIHRKKSEDLVFSDDDDFLGGLGIEDKGGAAAKVKAKVTEPEEENMPAKSVMDKLLGKDPTVNKHLEHGKERREFVLDSKYTLSQAKDNKESEDDFLFGSYMPSAAGGGTSNSSRPNSRRSVRFQDDDDIFGLNDAPSKPAATTTAKQDDGMDWLEMATGGKSKPSVEKSATEKVETKKQDPAPAQTTGGKPSTAPSKSTSAADWLGLKDDDDDDNDFDYLKSSSFSAPARQGQPTLKSLTTPSKPSPAVSSLKADESSKKDIGGGAGNKKDDYLGLGDEVDPSKLLRTKSDSPTFSRTFSRSDVLKDDDIFATANKSSIGKADQSPQNDEKMEDDSKSPTFESAARKMAMSPRMKSPSPRRSPERKPKEGSPRSLQEQLSQLQSSAGSAQGQMTPAASQSQTMPSVHTVPQVTSKDIQSEPEQDLNSSTNFFEFKKREPVPAASIGSAQGTSMPYSQSAEVSFMGGNVAQSPSMPQQATFPDLSSPFFQTSMSPMASTAGLPMNFATSPMTMTSSPMTMNTGMQPQTALQQQWQQQQQQMMQQQAKQQQLLMKQLQRQQQQIQRQQQQQMQKLQQQMQSSLAPELQMLGLDSRPMFQDDMGLGLGSFDMDAQAKIRRLEVELQYARDILISTKTRYEDEIVAIENSFKSRMQLIDETHSKKEKRWREENENLLTQQLSKLRMLEEEKSELVSSMYKKLEEAEAEKAREIERLKDIHRQSLESIKKDHEESLMRLKYSKDQQIEAAASSHDASRTLIAAVEMIRNNAKDVGALQRKIDSWHAQGLDDREITLRAKDEQLKMLQERLEKQQDDTEQERHRLQELVGRLETQIREQTRMLEEERWKVKQEQSRLQGMQTALEDERRAWSDHQARERANMEKSREGLLEEQKSVMTQLHKERQALAEEQVQFTMKQKMAREEGSNYAIKAAQSKAEYEALSKAITEAKERYDNIKEDIRKEQEHITEERRQLEKERVKMEKKEAELMEAANMLQEKSQQIEETYTEGQRKYEEGMSALSEAQRVESEERKRIDSINHQLNMLRVKEKEISEEKLRLSKEKREMEKFRNTLLCPNCRTPSRHVQGNMNVNQPASPQGLLMPTNGYHDGGMLNGAPVGYMHLQHSQPGVNPALQLSVNTMDQVTESIKSDRTIRLWKMEALRDQKYLEEQTLFLHTLKHMSSPKS